MADSAPAEQLPSEELYATEMGLFRPPLMRAAAVGEAIVLDRSRFVKTVNLAAAAVADKKQISGWRRKLQQDRSLISAERISAVVSHPEPALASKGTKCLLLDPRIRAGAPETWTPALRAGVQAAELGIVPYDLQLNYDYWLYEDVMRSILPMEVRDENDGFPVGFNQAGHVAHLNLREAFLPYRKVIAEVLVDKNASVRTVINKVASVGTESEFRTFAYEVLAGPDDLDVETRENDCVFRFDYSKVYWNSKLENEHRRLVNLFTPGEVVCDVMAGIGPFAVPAGKRGVFVWANDYNPESYRYLAENAKRNKVSQFVRSFNEDGRVFIRHAADMVFDASMRGEHAVVEPTRRDKRRQARKETSAAHSSSSSSSSPPPPAPAPAPEPAALPEPRRVPLPPTISHFVMNLPASALGFLPHFRGLYAGREHLFVPHTETELPLIHAHCFAGKGEDDGPLLDVAERVSRELGLGLDGKTTPLQLGRAGEPGEVEVLEVRNVAPNKRMFCASFRLPPEVAFAPRPDV
ncbi:Met-10+ like-protein-domain-containing protein [Biscogniauxia sp. FL1348]|nr:Met-10+ like-protein-domain-containing protein [Biscogniauxia sp. FL1348]